MHKSRLSLALLFLLAYSQSLAAEIKVTKWAEHPLLASPVGLSVDEKGRLYVTCTSRRKSSSLDIRQHRGWVKKDLSFKTTEDRRAFYMSLSDRISDHNKDGQKDWRDLTIQQDVVYRIEDTDGDGKADKSHPVGKFHSVMTGIAGGVLAHDNKLYVAVEPDFMIFEDKDGDGKPETGKVHSTGYQVHIGQGGHNMSGVTLGVDGRIYWSLADKGMHVEWTGASGKTHTHHYPNRGMIMRCEMDGSHLEVFASGPRNAQELAFDAYGNLFSMDNDGDYKGEMERVLYITKHSEHGWRLNWQWFKLQDFTKISGEEPYNVWMAEKLYLPDHKDHAAYMTPTIGNFGPGPCGFVFNPGTALNEDYKGKFLMTHFRNIVRAYEMKPKGAYFEPVDDKKLELKYGLSNTGLAFGPDGALYMGAWSSGYKVTDKGTIFRFDDPKVAKSKLRLETKRLIAEGASGAKDDELVRRLAHPDQRVRLAAQFELVKRNKVALLVKQAGDIKADQFARIHAMWGLGQLARKNSALAPHFMPLLEDADTEIRAQAAKMLGEVRDPSGVDKRMASQLIKLLSDASPRVNFFAAMAIGNLGVTHAQGTILGLLRSHDNKDAYLRHAGVTALVGTSSPEFIARSHRNDSRAVRLAAVVALRRLHSPLVAEFLDDEDELVVLEAARAIHDDLSIPEAIKLLAEVLKRTDIKREATLRRAINAALRSDQTIGLTYLADFIRRSDVDMKMRTTALAAMLWWDAPPVLDPVEGRYREYAPRDGKPRDMVLKALSDVISKNGALTKVMLNGAKVRKRSDWLLLLKGGNRDLATRVQQLEAMASSNDPDLKKEVADALKGEMQLKVVAMRYAKQVGLDRDRDYASLIEKGSDRQKRELMRQLIGRKDSAELKQLVGKYASQLASGKVKPSWRLEVMQAANAHGQKVPLTYDMLTDGGDAKRGEQLAMGHPAAQCIRCHKIGKTGGELGPNLSSVASRLPPEKLVESLMNPSAEIAKGYGIASLAMKDGSMIVGTLLDQKKGDWRIKMPDGKEKLVKGSDVKSSTLASSMPPMNMILKPAEIRDLVSYLRTLKTKKRRKK